MKPNTDKKNNQKIVDFADKSLLIVDDDNPLRDRLARAMEKKGFQVSQAQNAKEGVKEAQKLPQPLQ
jgi:two-component system, response regulator RegA